MTRTSRLLCLLYATIALAALYGTWSQNFAYFGPGAHGGGGFLPDLNANPASRSISIDIGWFLFAAAVLMVREARRIGLRFVWAYIVFAFLIAISVTFPLFLIAREIRLASTTPAPEAGPLTRALDITGLVAVGALTAALSVWLR